MSWTEERVEALKKLWGDGLSASKIAVQLGGVSRNAVIGKVHRLGLAGRAKDAESAPAPSAGSEAPVTRPQPQMEARPVTFGATALKLDMQPAPVPNARPAAENVVVPLARKLSIFKLTERTCKWPIGDPTESDFHFCGNEANEGAPYCEYHCRVAYQVPEPRRRKVATG